MDGNYKEGEMPVGEEELMAQVTSEKSCWSGWGPCMSWKCIGTGDEGHGASDSW